MKNQHKILMGILILLVGAAMIVAAVMMKKKSPPKTSETAEQAIPVAATFHVTATLLKEIGGDRVRSTVSLPSNIDVHEFEPSPQDIVALGSARLLVMHGAGLDAWAERLAPSLQEKNVRIVKLTDAIPFELTTTDEQGATIADPHVWLDPIFIIKEVNVVRDAVIDLDPSSREQFTSNAKRVEEQFTKLDEELQSGLQECAVRDIIVAHNAFSYFGKRYNITVHAIAGNTPEAEPSAQRLEELVNLAREKNISVIFNEPLEASDAAETLANEIGGTMVMLHTLEGFTDEENAAGEDYFSIMRKNLVNLQNAMHCDK